MSTGSARCHRWAGVPAQRKTGNWQQRLWPAQGLPLSFQASGLLPLLHLLLAL